MIRLRQRAGKYFRFGLLGWSFFLLIGTLLSFLIPTVYFSELFSHFRLQHVIFLCLALIYFRTEKRKGWLVLLFLGLLANASSFIPLIGSHAPPLGGKSLRVCSVNVLSYSHTYEKVIGYLQEENPDVGILIEVNQRWKEALASLYDTYPYRIDASAEGNYGMMLMSKIPFEYERIEYLGPMKSPMIVAQLSSGLTVAGVHVRSPDLYGKFLARNHSYRTLINRKGEYPAPMLFMGDFNTTTYSVHLRNFMNQMDLVDSRKGKGIFPSWPSLFFPLWVPIDHAFVSKNVWVKRRETGPYVGSDHLPILLELIHPDS